MDAELAASVIDDAFQAFGTPGCAYTAPDGSVVEGITVMRHRRVGERSKPGFSLGRGGLETTDRALSVVVRNREVAGPVMGGVFDMPARGGRAAQRLKIGEDPILDDSEGLTWRCSVEVL